MRALLIAAGAVAMVAGLAGAVTRAGLGVLVFLAVVLVLHDGVFLPVVGAAGRWLRGPWRVAGVVSLPVAVAGLPILIGPGEATVTAYAGILLLIWVVAAMFAIRKKLAARWRAPRG